MKIETQLNQIAILSVHTEKKTQTTQVLFFCILFLISKLIAVPDVGGIFPCQSLQFNMWVENGIDKAVEKLLSPPE